MIATKVNKIIDNREKTPDQIKYSNSITRFKKLIDRGVAEKRKNQLIIVETKIKYNF